MNLLFFLLARTMAIRRQIPVGLIAMMVVGYAKIEVSWYVCKYID